LSEFIEKSKMVMMNPNCQ